MGLDRNTAAIVINAIRRLSCVFAIGHFALNKTALRRSEVNPDSEEGDTRNAYSRTLTTEKSQLQARGLSRRLSRRENRLSRSSGHAPTSGRAASARFYRQLGAGSDDIVTLRHRCRCVDDDHLGACLRFFVDVYIVDCTTVAIIKSIAH